ncbi:hypothetical protein SASPL_107737 [Salvia splendens]|uniref:Protein kinase domain-containing protein n=1 Tax=Salvia splendens TaxID=180675 RepID=A0A8X8YCZ4_SALSN|nr:hypothetical protein SASPL_107737 [Salvia splendens]
MLHETSDLTAFLEREDSAMSSKDGSTSILLLLPDLDQAGRLTAKSDVYSFGVVMLELLSGRRAVDKTKVGVEQNLVDWAKPYMGDKRKLFRIMDIKLEGQYPQKAAFTAATIAVQCLSHEAKQRPRMAEVLAKLEELQAPKCAIRHLKTDNQQGEHVPILQSKHHSPMNMTPLASPVPAHRRSPHVR